MKNILNHKETAKTIALTLLIGLAAGFYLGVQAQQSNLSSAASTIKGSVAQPAQAAPATASK